MRLTERQQKALLIEANAQVEQWADEAARILCGLDPVRELTYPPNGGLSSEETKCLENLRQHPEAVAATRKVVAEAISAAFFHFLCCIDAVGTPRGYEGPWLPVTLHMPMDESEDESEDLNTYHSAFLDAYWDWRNLRPDPGWKLDNWR